jgi:hypothetical protein
MESPIRVVMKKKKVRIVTPNSQKRMEDEDIARRNAQIMRDFWDDWKVWMRKNDMRDADIPSHILRKIDSMSVDHRVEVQRSLAMMDITTMSKELKIKEEIFMAKNKNMLRYRKIFNSLDESLEDVSIY